MRGRNPASSNPRSKSLPQPVPVIDQRILKVFRWFVRGYVRRHFHAMATNNDALKEMKLEPDDALVVYANHPSWWDPLSALLLADRTFPEYRLFAPIDAIALAKYPMFGRLGFFGVNQLSRRGAADFLRISHDILSQPKSSIWLTPQGRFVDPRETEAELSSGLAHLAMSFATATADASIANPDTANPDTANPTDVAKANRSPHRVWFVPGAVEYAFWEEPKPEILCWFGRPFLITPGSLPTDFMTCDDDLPSPDIAEAEGTQPAGGRTADKAAWNRLLHSRLCEAQQQLSIASIVRDSRPFEIVLGGSRGTFFIYDWWRKGLAALRGQRLDLNHGDKLQP